MSRLNRLRSAAWRRVACVAIPAATWMLVAAFVGVIITAILLVVGDTSMIPDGIWWGLAALSLTAFLVWLLGEYAHSRASWKGGPS